MRNEEIMTLLPIIYFLIVQEADGIQAEGHF
jgi:hypothetical protein